MSNVKINWHGDEWFDDFQRDPKQRITKAAITLANEVKQELSVPVKREKGEPGRSADGKFTAGKESVERSAPGEPPRKEHGELRRSIAWEVDDSGDEIVGRVGTNKRYGLWLEVGTSKMEPRPYLRPTLDKLWDKLASIIQAK